VPRGGAGTSAAHSSFATLERTLDRTIEHLSAGSQTRDVRALTIEARRLRSVIANWRSIPPPPDVHDEMLDRVLQLSNAVGSALGPLDGPEGPAESEPPLQLDFEPAPPRPDMGGRRTDPRAFGSRRPLDARPTAERRPFDARTPPERRAPEPARPVERRRTESVRPTGRRTQDPFRDEDPRPRAPVEPAAERDDLDAYALDFEPRLYTHHAATGRSDRQARDDVSSDRSSALPEPPAPPRPVEAAPPRPPSPLPPPPADTSAELASASSLSEPAREPLTSVGPGATATEPASRASLPTGITVYDAPPVVSYETESYNLAVPRTQIVAHPVKLSDPVNAQLVYHLDPYSDRADAYRAIRRKLASNAALRVLAVTSAHPGEGKTVFAVNLALALRERVRERVLIVEANLRHPFLGEMLGFAPPECFLAQLAGHAEDPRAPWVVAEPMPKLHVMAIDPTAPHDPMLDPVTFSMGMERLKQAGYEYIIVDAPAVLGGVDCNVISDSVDALILTALPLKSKRKEMRKAVEQLEPAPILGVVVLEV
jgi:Mrp family chromosome partitioning ATPase